MNCDPCARRGKTSEAEKEVAGENWCLHCFYDGDQALIEKARGGWVPKVKRYVKKGPARHGRPQPDPYRPVGQRKEILERLVKEQKLRIPFIDAHDRRYFHQTAYRMKMRIRMTVEGEWLYLALKEVLSRCGVAGDPQPKSNPNSEGREFASVNQQGQLQGM